MSWRDEAACKGKPTEWWFPNQGETASLALAICKRCPVADECREYADTAGERYGVWGGATGRLRRTGRTSRAVTNADRVREELRVARSWITAEEVHRRTGLSRDVVANRLTHLRDQGLAHHNAEMRAWMYREVTV